MMCRLPPATVIVVVIIASLRCLPGIDAQDMDPMEGQAQAADFKIRLYASEQLQKFDDMGNILINGSFQGDTMLKINVIPPDERAVQNPFNWSSDYEPGLILKLTDEDMCQMILAAKSAVCGRKHQNNPFRQRYCIASEELFLRYPDRLLGREMVAPLKCVQPLIRDVFRLFLMDQFYCRAILLDEDSFISDSTPLMSELKPPNVKSGWREFSMVYFCTAFMASNLLFNKPASRAHFTINTCHLNPTVPEYDELEKKMKNGSESMVPAYPEAHNHSLCSNGIIYCFESPTALMAPSPGGAHLVNSQLKTICQRRAGVRIFSETYRDNRTYASVETMHGGSYHFELPDDRCFTMDFGAGDHDATLRRTDGSTIWDDYGQPVMLNPYETAVKTLPAPPVIAASIAVQGGGPDCNQYAIIYGENFSRCFFKWNAVLTCSNRKGAHERVCEIAHKTGVRTTHENETSITDSSTKKNETKESKPIDARSAISHHSQQAASGSADTVGVLDEPPTVKPLASEGARRRAAVAHRRARGRGRKGGGYGRTYVNSQRTEYPTHRVRQPSPEQSLGGPPVGAPPEYSGKSGLGRRLVRGVLDDGVTGVVSAAMGDRCSRQHKSVKSQILWAAGCAASDFFQTEFRPIQEKFGRAVKEGIRSQLGLGDKPGAGPPGNVSPSALGADPSGADGDTGGDFPGGGPGGDDGGGGGGGGMGAGSMCGAAMQKTRGEISTSFSEATTHSETNRLMDATTLINETTITSRITTPPGFDQVLAQLEFHCNGLIIATNVLDVFSASLNDTGSAEKGFMDTMGNLWKAVRKPLIKVGVGLLAKGLQAGITAATGGVGGLIAGPLIDAGSEWASCQLVQLAGDQCDDQQEAQKQEEAAQPDQPPPAITGGGPEGQPTNWKQAPCGG